MTSTAAIRKNARRTFYVAQPTRRKGGMKRTSSEEGSGPLRFWGGGDRERKFFRGGRKTGRVGNSSGRVGTKARGKNLRAGGFQKEDSRREEGARDYKFGGGKTRPASHKEPLEPSHRNGA